MFGRKRKLDVEPRQDDAPRLQEAVHQARIETAERTNVVVDLRDAELARLELLNEALDPLFGEIPAEVEIFDRGISHGDQPRLWIDMLAHVVMGRDKRQYRFVQDIRYGRKVLAKSTDIQDIVEAVTRYVANRLVERERALAFLADANAPTIQHDVRIIWRKRRWRMLRAFMFGLVLGVGVLFAALWIVASRLH